MKRLCKVVCRSCKKRYGSEDLYKRCKSCGCEIILRWEDGIKPPPRRRTFGMS